MLISNEIPTPKREITIILLGPDNLFALSVEALLKTKVNSEILRATEHNMLGSLLKQVKGEHAYVIVIKEGDCPDDFPFPLHQQNPQIKVITVDQESNQVEIFNREKMTVKQIADLVSLIDG